MVHPGPGHAPLCPLAVHRDLVPVFLGRTKAEAGEAGKRGRWRHGGVEAGHVEAVHGHRQRVYWLLVEAVQLGRLFAGGLEAGDEDDDGHDDTNHNGRGGGDDDVVEPLGAADTLGADLPALLEGHVGGGDLDLLQGDNADDDALLYSDIFKCYIF